MTLTLRSTEVGDSLDKYVSETLSVGVFGKGFVERNPVKLQKAFLLLSENDIENIRYNEGCDFAEGDIFNAMAQILFAESLLHQKAIIFEHTVARITDPFVEHLPIVPFSYENGVLFALEGDGLTYSAVENTLNTCFSAIGLTAFLLPDGLIEISENKEIANPRIVFDAIETIIVGIYDNETFLMAYPR